MAATVQIREKNGAGETPTVKTAGSVRFKTADNATVDLNNPIQVPGSGQAYSKIKALRLHIAGGTFTQINNIRVYTDGSNGYGTGCDLFAAASAAYTQPATPSTSNDPPLFAASPMASVFGYTTGSPLSLSTLNAGPYDSTGVPKDIGDYLNLCFQVKSTASQGVRTAETLTFVWDEI